MSVADFLKLAAVLPLFLVIAPGLGAVMKNRRSWQRVVFALMCFMTINGLLGAGNWGLTVGSIESYRGHAKGYHFYFNQALAIALIVARFLEKGPDMRRIPPGTLWFLLYCGASFLSIVNAPRPDYVFMAAHKMMFAGLIALASYYHLRNEDDLQFFVRVMAFTMAWQLAVCLKMKYLDGMYQVRGTFEHQNPLAMYSVMIGMVLLAVGLGPPFPGAGLALFGFLASAVVVQCTLSRAALAIFGAGTVAVMGISLLEKPTSRRLGVAAGLGLVGALGLLLTLDTIVARFNDHGNQASSELREVMNAASRWMLEDHALGIGWNNFAHAFNPPFPYVEKLHEWILGRGMRVQEDIASPVVESHYWLLLAETGYTGFGAYLLLIGIALWRNVRAFFGFGHGFVRCLSLGIAIGCGLNYAQSTLERVLVQPRNLMLWLILLGITGRVETMRRERKRLAAASRAAVPTRPSA